MRSLKQPGPPESGAVLATVNTKPASPVRFAQCCLPSRKRGTAAVRGALSQMQAGAEKRHFSRTEKRTLIGG
jgi:hypothetical protein